MDFDMVLQHTFNKQQFLNLFDNVDIGIIVINADGEIEFTNRYLRREFGYRESELHRQKVEVLIPARYGDVHRGLRSKYVKIPANIAIVKEKNLVGLRKDGSEFQVEISLGHCKEREETYFVAFVNDLTQKLKAEETISQLNADLEQRVKESTRTLNATIEQLVLQIKENERKDEELMKALEKEKELNQLKSRFVSVASHEFRTPLSGILGSTYLLSKYKKESEQPQRDKHIGRILTSVNLLNEVLSDFLSVDKMEQANFKPNITEFNIGDVVNEIIQNMQFQLKKGQHINYVHEGTIDKVFFDQSMLQHIITNLLSNAVKYSPEESSIDLQVSCNNQVLVFKVKDYGIGVPKREQVNLFKRFFRSSNAAHIQGTGLGLSIVKKYVEVLGGTIEFVSEENKGTEFTVSFKITEQDENNIGC